MKILDRLTEQSKHISGGLVHIEPGDLQSLIAVARAAKLVSDHGSDESICNLDEA